MTVVDLKDKNHRLLFRYWNKLRGDLPMPRKSDFRPAPIKEGLHLFTLFEVREPTQIIVRIHGTGNVQRWGRDLTGSNVLDFMSPARPIVDLYQKVLRTPSGHISSYVGEYENGRADLIGTLLLPMSDDAGVPLFVAMMASRADVHGYSDAHPGRMRIKEQLDQQFIDLGFGLPE